MGKRNSMFVRECVSASVRMWRVRLHRVTIWHDTLVPGVLELFHTNVHVGEMRRWRRGYEEVPDVVTLGNAIIMNSFGLLKGKEKMGLWVRSVSMSDD